MHAEWRKSTFSSPVGDDCVEVSYSTEVHLRDSKNPDGGTLHLPASSWAPHLLARTE
ncbi:protein of unknown function [Actinokineospora alba]|uniref:DUF397 domain-containing protein n=1 Tax=Actinokineospora alba TaxID=504798 RepID=A0A1H0TJM9_9PSEU|nr:DUF397 domain-containing protein [Actinokineospora alba]TDP70555.1 uncharacterized protein DUF397 [Actinokineospora alba]SDJ09944.1 protein of unknown function [Actinokineospora alba]SDP54189.1 protein of unknown function [Actinokineospora alba]